MASEANVDINKIQGSGKMDNFKRRCYEFNGSKPSPSERKTKHTEERVKMTRLRLTIAKIKRSSRKCSYAYYFL